MVELDKIICGDCLEELPAIPEDSIDAICTDPPAGIAFMGKEWDKDKGGRDKWIAWMEEVAFGCLRAVKPGGHALVWALPRTSHWTGMAWENAGWEPRDKISHVFGSGFPKGLDISKALGKMAGAEREVIGKREQPDIRGDSFQNRLRHGVSGNVEILDTLPATPAARQWAGFGTALKPAHEDWWLFRKPLDQPTIASNVLRWGCGGINIDGCRVEMNGETWDKNIGSSILGKNITGNSLCLSKDECFREIEKRSSPLGRFPANLIHDGSQPVLAEFAKAGQTTYSDKRVCKIQRTPRNDGSGAIYGKDTNLDPQPCYSDTGSPARFFQACPFTEEDIPAFLYYAKASKSERGEGNTHPTVKNLSLMKYLCRLICPPGGLILDPFAGSGTTCLAAKQEGFHFIGIEKEAEYAEIARRRIAAIPTSLSRWEEDYNLSVFNP